MKYDWSSRLLKEVQRIARQKALRKLQSRGIDASNQVGFHIQRGIQENA